MSTQANPIIADENGGRLTGGSVFNSMCCDE